MVSNIFKKIKSLFGDIGNNVKVIAANHPILFASTHPFFYQAKYGNVDTDIFEDYVYVPFNQQKRNLGR